MILRRVLLVFALGGVVWAAILVVGLLAGVRLLPMAVAAPVGAALVFPAFVVSVVDRSTLHGPRTRRSGPWRFRRLLGDLPGWAQVVAGGSFFLFWLAGMTAFAGVGGSAGIRDGQYVLDNHGVVTVVDKATYERQLGLEQRIFLSGFGAFGVGGATLLAGSIARPRHGPDSDAVSTGQ